MRMFPWTVPGLLIAVLAGTFAGQPDSIANGGDTIANATLIPSLPYSDTGTTCQMADNYKASCNVVDIYDRDVVYAFAPTGSMCVDIKVCDLAPFSGRPVLHVHANSYPNEIGCSANSDSLPDNCELFRPASTLYRLHLQGGTTYYLIVDSYGRVCINYSMTVEVHVCHPTDAQDLLPHDFEIAAGKNPVRGPVQLTMGVPRSAPVDVRIYDVTGREVRTLMQGVVTPGRHVLDWDGRNAVGERAASGIYFVDMRAGDVHRALHVAVLR